VLQNLDINGNGDDGGRLDNHTGIRIEQSKNILIRNNRIQNVYTAHNVNNGAGIQVYSGRPRVRAQRDLHLLAFVGRQTWTPSLVTLRLSNPSAKRFGGASEFLGHRPNGRPLRRVLVGRYAHPQRRRYHPIAAHVLALHTPATGVTHVTLPSLPQISALRRTSARNSMLKTGACLASPLTHHDAVSNDPLGRTLVR
jgi:hypothetical protein